MEINKSPKTPEIAILGRNATPAAIATAVLPPETKTFNI
jgi:hypothetical protein